MRNRTIVPLFALLSGVVGLVGCGDRPDAYEAPSAISQTFGLERHVALVDDGAHRVLLLTPHAGQEIERTSLPIGKSVVSAASSADGKRLFVLSLGDLTRKKESDERASLTMIENGVAKRFPLESPHSGLAIDPRGRWVALYAAPNQGQRTFVENPNEIVIVDLEAPFESAVTPRTLRSFGGRPQRLSFTQPLGLPSGPRRLLVVETDQDVALLDLDNVRSVPQRPEITVRLTNGATAEQARPAGIAVDDGEAASSSDSRIGIRMVTGTSVVTLTLVPTPAGTKTEDPSQVPNDFATEVNLTDVGGVPGDIAFVRTDVGLRLAAIIPAAKRAVLVDPQTSLVTDIDLPEPYARLSLITNVVGGGGGTDTALLYGAGGARGVAFWSLGRATGKPYRSVEVISLQAGISGVLDVPPPRPELKVLEGQGTNAFYVLNLASRTASPLTTLGSAALHVSRDGQRLWAYERGRPSLAQVALGDLHPIPLPLDRPIDSVYETATAEGGRSLIALDARGAAGVTVLDALAPDTATARSYYGLLMEDL